MNSRDQASGTIRSGERHRRRDLDELSSRPRESSVWALNIRALRETSRNPNLKL